MQIISYDANLSFFMNEFIIYVISTYKIIINVFFALNLKICRILQFTIRYYNLRSHLPSMILRRFLILTTLLIFIIVGIGIELFPVLSHQWTPIDSICTVFFSSLSLDIDLSLMIEVLSATPSEWKVPASRRFFYHFQYFLHFPAYCNLRNTEKAFCCRPPLPESDRL